MFRTAILGHSTRLFPEVKCNKWQYVIVNMYITPTWCRTCIGFYFAMMPSHLDEVHLFLKSESETLCSFSSKFGLRFEYLQTNVAKYPCLFINDFYKSIVDYILEDMIMNFAVIVSLTIKAVRNVCPLSSFL